MAWPPEFYCSQHRHIENSQSVLCAKTIQKVMNDARFWVMSHDFCVASSFLVFNFCCHGNCPEEHRLSVISCRHSDNTSKKSGTVSITVNQYLLDSSGPSWATLGTCTEICPELTHGWTQTQEVSWVKEGSSRIQPRIKAIHSVELGFSWLNH